MTGPVTVSANAPVIATQRPQTSTHYLSEVPAQSVVPGLPGAPTTLVAIPFNGQVNLLWSAPSNVRSGVTGYQVTASNRTTAAPTAAPPSPSASRLTTPTHPHAST